MVAHQVAGDGEAECACIRDRPRPAIVVQAQIGFLDDVLAIRMMIEPAAYEAAQRPTQIRVRAIDMPPMRDGR